MKKTLVAVAAMAAVSGAMAEVTISGALEVGIANTAAKTSGGTSSSVKSLDDTNGNNVINFTVKEDLGSGMAADVNIGIYPSLDYGTAAGGYQTYMGLSGASFGRIQGGAFATNAFTTILNGDATGAAGQGPLIGIGMNANGDRTGWAGASLFDANQLSYTLPTFVTGLGLNYTKKFGESTTSAGTGDASSYKVSYVSGPVSVAYTSQTGKYSSSLTDKGTVLTGNYDLGMAKVFAGYATLKQGTSNTLSATSYGINVPFNGLTFMWNYATVNGGQATTAITAGTIGQNQTEYGVKYELSKRTSVTYIYSNRNNGLGNATAAYTTGSTNTLNKVFVVHSF